MLTPDEEERYLRQTMIPALGAKGQLRLKEAKVLVAGLGGLGTPAALYLAAAGVGTLRIVDSDVVQLSNLNRQLLYTTAEIGQSKSSCAQQRIRELNPHVRIEAIGTQIEQNNVMDLVDECDLIVDALDNYPTRYIMNKAAIATRTPLLHGSLSEFDGVTTTVIPGRTPCLRCIFPEPPPPTTTPVLGAIPGIIGCIQALEAIKYLTGVGTLLTGRLLLLDGLELKFREMTVKRDPKCPDCRGVQPNNRRN
jgi:molybdopterin/thiamine biosynthesis adenylyltransferase